MQLAFEITANFYGEAEAEKAQNAFVRLFQQKDIPQEMPEFQYTKGQTVLEVLIAASLVGSKSEGRRLIEQKGVRFDGEVLTDGAQPMPGDGVLQVGKRHFIKVVPV